MHIAVVLTLFVSMTLVGLGVLLNQQRAIATEYLGNQLEIATYLCRDSDANPSCTTAATDAQKEQIEAVIEDSPEVESYRFETKEEAFEKVKKLLGEDQFAGPNPVMTAEDMSEAYWITLNDPKEFEGITSAVVGLDGVSQIRDERETVKPLFDSLDTLKYASWAVAGFLLSRPRCCWWPTRSGWRRSRAARRSASCDWSARPRSTSRCRSCSRRW